MTTTQKVRHKFFVNLAIKMKEHICPARMPYFVDDQQFAAMTLVSPVENDYNSRGALATCAANTDLQTRLVASGDPRFNCRGPIEATWWRRSGGPSHRDPRFNCRGPIEACNPEHGCIPRLGVIHGSTAVAPLKQGLQVQIRHAIPL